LKLGFFPATELGPPHLLGEIIDLNRPKRIIAGVFIEGEDRTQILAVVDLTREQRDELDRFAAQLDPSRIDKVAVHDVMGRNRRRAMS